MRVEALDAAVAIALDVPTAASTAPLDASDKAGGAADLAAVEGGDVPNSSGPHGAKPVRSRKAPFIKNAVTLITIFSSLAAWMAIIKGAAASFAALPRALSSRTEMNKGASVC